MTLRLTIKEAANGAASLRGEGTCFGAFTKQKWRINIMKENYKPVSVQQLH